jgi:hypothetical protein
VRTVAGSCRCQAQAGRGSTRRWKASWSVDVVVFDETAAKAGLAFGTRRRKGRKLRPAASHRARQRASEATLPTRSAVENAASEGHRRRGCRSQHPPGPSGVSSHHRRGLWPETMNAARWVARAEAGGSPSSEAPPGSLVASAMSAHIDSGFDLERWAAREEGRKADRERTRESINPKGARVVGRLQKSGRRIFSVPHAVSRKAIRRGRGSLKRPPCH